MVVLSRYFGASEVVTPNGRLIRAVLVKLSNLQQCPLVMVVLLPNLLVLGKFLKSKLGQVEITHLPI
jgi:hypothetical protein